MSAFRYIDVERRGDACCVRLRRARLDEAEMCSLADELLAVAQGETCHKLALALGPQPPEFLYSVFLAKLVQMRRVLAERGGDLILCHAGPEVRSIFSTCSLDALFHFEPDFDSALAAWSRGTATA
jgi:anti-anti-sigma factor